MTLTHGAVNSDNENFTPESRSGRVRVSCKMEVAIDKFSADFADPENYGESGFEAAKCDETFFSHKQNKYSCGD